MEHGEGRRREIKVGGSHAGQGSVGPPAIDTELNKHDILYYKRSTRLLQIKKREDNGEEWCVRQRAHTREKDEKKRWVTEARESVVHERFH